MFCKTVASTNSTTTEGEREYLKSIEQKNGTMVSDVYPDLKEIMDYIKSKNLPKTKENLKKNKNKIK